MVLVDPSEKKSAELKYSSAMSSPKMSIVAMVLLPTSSIISFSLNQSMSPGNHDCLLIKGGSRIFSTKILSTFF